MGPHTNRWRHGRGSQIHFRAPQAGARAVGLSNFRVNHGGRVHIVAPAEPRHCSSAAPPRLARLFATASQACAAVSEKMWVAPQQLDGQWQRSRRRGMNRAQTGPITDSDLVFLFFHPLHTELHRATAPGSTAVRINVCMHQRFMIRGEYHRLLAAAMCILRMLQIRCARHWQPWIDAPAVRDKPIADGRNRHHSQTLPTLSAALSPMNQSHSQ